MRVSWLKSKSGSSSHTGGSVHWEGPLNCTLWLHQHKDNQHHIFHHTSIAMTIAVMTNDHAIDQRPPPAPWWLLPTMTTRMTTTTTTTKTTRILTNNQHLFPTTAIFYICKSEPLPFLPNKRGCYFFDKRNGVTLTVFLKLFTFITLRFLLRSVVHLQTLTALNFG